MPHTISIHPGEVLKDELAERGVSESDLAAHTRVPPAAINRICRAQRGISTKMAVKLSLALGASPAFWLNLQKNWELSRVK